MTVREIFASALSTEEFFRTCAEQGVTFDHSRAAYTGDAGGELAGPYVAPDDPTYRRLQTLDKALRQYAAKYPENRALRTWVEAEDFYPSGASGDKPIWELPGHDWPEGH